jgi:hypothetical protein
MMPASSIMEIATPQLCKMVSTSDAFTPTKHTRVQVIWTLSVKRVDADECEYTNSVVVHPTAAFMDFIDKYGQTFEAAGRGAPAREGRPKSTRGAAHPPNVSQRAGSHASATPLWRP